MSNLEIKSRIDQELRDRAPSAAIGGIALIFALTNLTHAPVFSNFCVFISAAAIVVANLIRLWAFKKVTHSWRTFSTLTVLATAFGWASFSSWIFLSYHFNQFESQITLLFLSGVASSSLLTLAADPKLFRCYLGLVLWVPISVYCLQYQDKTSLQYLALFVAFSVFLMGQASAYFKSLSQKFKNEIKLLEDHSLLRTVLDAVPGLISYIDKDLNYVAMNRNLRAALSLKDGDCIGRKVGFFDEAGEWTQRLRQFHVSDRTSLNFEMLIEVNKEKRWHLVSMRKSNDLQWLVCVSLDIHYEKSLSLQAEEQRARNEVAAKLAALGEMSSGVAHEINNPLAIIKGRAQSIFRMAERTGDQQEMLQRHSESIARTSDRIAKIVKSLRSFARDASHDPLENYPITNIVEEALNLCRNRFQNEDIDVIVDTIPEHWKIECRPTELSQVILNLLNNARDAIDALPEKWVRITVSEYYAGFEIAITDSGKGIPIELREKIIQPFFTTKEVGKGTGLGLSVAVGIVNNLHGSLQIDGASANTRFVIRIPVNQALVA